MPYQLELWTHSYVDGKSIHAADLSHPFSEDCPYAKGDPVRYADVDWKATKVEPDDDGTLVTCERFIDSSGESQPGDAQDLIVARTKADAD